MKFSVSSKALAACAQAVSRIINAKNALAILNNFKLELQPDGMLSITASDGENFLTGRLPVMTDDTEASAVCVDARRLCDLLKDLPEVGINVDIDPEANYAMNVRYANGEFAFMALPGLEYPKPGDKEGQEEPKMRFEVEMSRVLRAIDYTIFAVGSDEIRPQMMGVLWDVKPESVTFVATDTRKLVKFVDQGIQPGAEGRFIAPLKSMTILRNVFAKSEAVCVTADDKGIVFESPEFLFISRFVKGNFPDYNRVIPQANPYTMTVERSVFLSGVKRIGSFCDAANGLVRFKIEPDRLILKASESQVNASAWESTPCDFSGPELVIGFSAPYVGEILSTMQSPEVLVKLADPSRPALFIPSQCDPDTELVMLLMPMLVAEF